MRETAAVTPHLDIVAGGAGSSFTQRFIPADHSLTRTHTDTEDF